MFRRLPQHGCILAVQPSFCLATTIVGAYCRHCILIRLRLTDAITVFDASAPLCQPKCMRQSVDLSGTAFCDVDGTGYAGDFITYLNQAAHHFDSLKVFTHSLLRLRPGEKVLDVGCGCGDDLRELATGVTPNGCAVGIDISQSMIDEARRRNAGCELPLQFELGDAGHLRWHPDYFDACRADRVFQHLPDPERALNEMIRVLKPGGRVLVVDRDWGMVAVDASDVDTTRVVLNRACAGIRNGWMGRRLCALFKKAAVINAEVQTKSININSFAVADTLLDLRVVLGHAVGERLVSQDVATKWLIDLLDRDAAGRFFATVTLYIACGGKKGSSMST
jgi:SAM-dependent methyltransferase